MRSNPRFEPKIIETEAQKRWHGDIEKVATTSIRALEVHDVVLSNRYNKAHEYKDMAALIVELSPEFRSIIEPIWSPPTAPTRTAD